LVVLKEGGIRVKIAVYELVENEKGGFVFLFLNMRYHFGFPRFNVRHFIIVCNPSPVRQFSKSLQFVDTVFITTKLQQKFSFTKSQKKTRQVKISVALSYPDLRQRIHHSVADRDALEINLLLGSRIVHVDSIC
jgi:hypothetical protein